MIKDYINYEGPVVSTIFMVKSVSRAVSSTGNPYLSIVLQDVSGTIDGKKWQIDEADVAMAVPGKLVKIDGNILIYKGKSQLKINSMEPVDERDVDLSKYVQVAPISKDEMKKTLESYIDMIEDDEIKTLTKTLIKNSYETFTSYPAAVTVHHAYLGGLLYHSLSICELAIEVQKHYPYLIKDYLISGSLLHDIGKTRELSAPIAPSYTIEGNLLGHITIGAMMVYQEGKKEMINEEKLTVLTHLILSHHGCPEYGSSKTPMTPEAFVLHALDDLDAKMETLKNLFKNTESGEFTNKVPFMENSIFFKPDSLEELNREEEE